MSHFVYKISYPGPGHSPRRNRVAILVEPKSGKGDRYIFAVKGNIHHEDMIYGVEYPSENSSGEPDEFSRSDPVGVIDIEAETDLVKFAEVCESIQPPLRQFNKFGKKLYPDSLVRRSKEWVEETLMALREKGTIKTPENMLLQKHEWERY
jgi:hypothetical protein